MVEATVSKKSGSKLKLLLWVLVIAGLLAAAKYFNVQEILRKALDWIAGLGAWGPITFLILYVLATVFFIPGSVLTLGAGFLFGVIKGSILVSIASTLGATCAFLVGRYLARGWVSKKIDLPGQNIYKPINQ